MSFTHNIPEYRIYTKIFSFVDLDMFYLMFVIRACVIAFSKNAARFPGYTRASWPTDRPGPLETEGRPGEMMASVAALQAASGLDLYGSTILR
jgi:hypothetical protein